MKYKKKEKHIDKQKENEDGKKNRKQEICKEIYTK